MCLENKNNLLVILVFSLSSLYLLMLFSTNTLAININVPHEWYRYQGDPDPTYGVANPLINADCGPTCVAMAYQFVKNDKIPIKEICNDIGHSITNSEDYKQVLNKYGISYNSLPDGSQDDRAQSVLNAINSRHHIVICIVDMSKFSNGPDLKDVPELNGDLTDPAQHYDRYRTYNNWHAIVIKGVTEYNDKQWIIAYDPYVFCKGIVGDHSDNRYWYSNGEPKGKERYYHITDFIKATPTGAINIFGAIEITGSIDDIKKANVQEIPKEIIGKDDAKMVLIPAGEFQMGSNITVFYLDGEPIHTVYPNFNETPIHMVYLDAFYMDVYEVTNAQYKKFTDATGHRMPSYWNDSTYNALNHPVVGVSWDDAVAYCKWADKRLPTEAEWEKAARGGLTGKKYPWGDTITHDNANYYDTGGKDIWNGTVPVGSFAPNGYGLYDMAGNVSEWCADWYNAGYYTISPKLNPTGPSSGQYKVLRGRGWDTATEIYLNTAVRSYSNPTSISISYGFRCVMDIPK